MIINQRNRLKGAIKYLEIVPGKEVRKRDTHLN